MSRDLTQEQVKELFNYCDERGALIWKKPKAGVAFGDPAGTLHHTGYIVISRKDTKYNAHRLVWIFHNGAIPEDMVIDHISGVRNDNRISNLQLCTKSQNTMKSTVNQSNTSSVTGVTWHKNAKCWEARIGYGNSMHYIGSSKCKDEAIAMRLAAEVERYGEFAPSLHAYTGQPSGDKNDSNNR